MVNFRLFPVIFYFSVDRFSGIFYLGLVNRVLFNYIYWDYTFSTLLSAHIENHIFLLLYDVSHSRYCPNVLELRSAAVKSFYWPYSILYSRAITILE